MSADPRSKVPRIDFNTADLESLIERIESITDPRQKRGVRHRFSTTLVLIACATLAGHKSLVALSEWCDSSSQEVLARLGARISPTTGKRTPPSYATIRRAAMSVHPDELDLVVNTWAGGQADRRGRTPVIPTTTVSKVEDDDSDTIDPTVDRDGRDDHPEVGADLVGIAVDGKTVRGAKRTDGTQVQLLAALRHDTGMVIGQANVENDKTNEILAFTPLLTPVALSGTVITADALHTQRKAADFVIARGGHYIWGVKGNQLRLHDAAVEAFDGIDFDQPEHLSCLRGHGRIDRHRVWSAPLLSDTFIGDGSPPERHRT
jgi:hypothetical protein